jgi:pentatricopeptide repeat protein
MPHRDIIAWNSMIFAYCNNGMPDTARSLAAAISGGNLRTGTILLSGYARLGRVRDARRMFDEITVRNVVPWNDQLLCQEWGHQPCAQAVRCNAEQRSHFMEHNAYRILPLSANGGCKESV